MAYSNVIHARSLGRGQTGISQVDGTNGTIVDDTVYLTSLKDMESGARAVAYSPKRITEKVDGTEVLQAIELELPNGKVVWENPFRRFGMTEGQVSVADELWSIACAIREGREPDYGSAAGRLDQEMNIGQLESAVQNRQTITFPLSSLTRCEGETHERFVQRHSCDPFDVEKLATTFFGRV